MRIRGVLWLLVAILVLGLVIFAGSIFFYYSTGYFAVTRPDLQP
jgi:hypothetical protein